jgi:F-type H+-transporting ATPase subunit a
VYCLVSVRSPSTETPLFRALPADLNFTFALAIITIIASQIYAVRKHGFFGNIGRYLKNPIKDPIGAFEGILEFVGVSFSRLVALSFRLFGNAFAGEVLLLLIAVLTSYFASVVLPFFMAFELFHRLYPGICLLCAYTDFHFPRPCNPWRPFI